MTENDKTVSTENDSADDRDVTPETQESPGTENKGTAVGSRLSRIVTPRRILLLVLLILVSAMAGGGYWGWMQLQQQLNGMNGRTQQLAQELETASARIRRFEAAGEQTDQQWRSAFDELESLVVESAQRWNAQSNRTENRWPLEEALTLTRLAAQRLQLDADATIAVRMLQAADKILSELDQAAVLPLRRQLAADILSLRSVESADINGLYFQLEAAAGQIRSLDWVPQPQSRTALPDNIDLVEGFWNSLKQVVVISRLDVPMEPVALQGDFERWRQHTLLLIEQTQLALLAGNQELFDAALQQSLGQLDVMRSQLQLAALRESLTDMTGAQLNPEWPDIDASVEALETYLAGVSSESDDAESPGEGSTVDIDSDNAEGDS